MSFKTIINEHPVDNSAISGNGTHEVYVSPTFKSPQDYADSDSGLDVVIRYSDNLPYPDGSIPINYSISAVLETQDDTGHWHVFHNQFVPFLKRENGDTHKLIMNPDILAEAGTSIQVNIGNDIAVQESQKQGQKKLPDEWRLRVLVSENGYGVGAAANEAGPGSFQSAAITASYKTY